MRYVFADFDEFADAISGLDGRYIPTAHSDEQWWIDPVHLGRLRLQQLQVGAASTFAGDGEPAGLTIGIPLSDPAAIRIDGESLASNGFILIRKDCPLTYSAQLATRWIGVTVPADLWGDARFKDAVEWSSAMLSNTSVQADTAALRSLSAVIGALCSGEQSINVVDATAIAAAEEEIVAMAAQVLRSSTCMVEDRRRPGRPPFERERVIARCLEFLEANHGRPLLVADLCGVAEVSERTLRNIFNEYFGVGPVRLLKVRQLQEVRSALLRARSSRETATSIASRLGVWDYGLFSRSYRALYHETPAQTLRNWRPRGDLPSAMPADAHSMHSWMKYASQCFAGG